MQIFDSGHFGATKFAQDISVQIIGAGQIGAGQNRRREKMN